MATPQELDYAKIKEIANEYYDEKFLDAIRHFQHFELDYSHPDYKFCAFDLHQVAECLIKTVVLVYALYGHKEHDLKFLLNKSKGYTPELVKVFPRDTAEEKRLFELLRRAYLEARYNKKNFIVTKEDIDALKPKVEQLKQVVGRGLPRTHCLLRKSDREIAITQEQIIQLFEGNSLSTITLFSSKAVLYNFFVKPNEQSEIYFGFAAARKSAWNERNAGARRWAVLGVLPIAERQGAAVECRFSRKKTKNQIIIRFFTNCSLNCWGVKPRMRLKMRLKLEMLLKPQR